MRGRVAKRPGGLPGDTLSTLIEAKLADLRRGMDVRDSEGLAQAQRDLRSGDGRWLTETVEAVRAEMEAIEGAELREHRRAWFERTALADAIFLVANVVLLALVVAAGLAARAEMRRREERAQERLRMLELQERILGIVSHDLRTPLAAIDAGAALFSRSGLPPKQARIATLMHSSSRRMERIIRDLLDYTRTRAREGNPLSIRATDLGEVCARVVEETALHERAVALELHRDGEPGGVGYRPARAGHRQSRRQRGPSRAPRAHRSASGRSARGIGCGSRSRTTGRPCRPRRRADVRPLPGIVRRRCRSGPGAAGLGLFIVRSIVEAHGGTVDVQATRPVRTSRFASAGAPAAAGRHAHERLAPDGSRASARRLGREMTLGPGAREPCAGAGAVPRRVAPSIGRRHASAASFEGGEP